MTQDEFRRISWHGINKRCLAVFDAWMRAGGFTASMPRHFFFLWGRWKFAFSCCATILSSLCVLDRWRPAAVRLTHDSFSFVLGDTAVWRRPPCTNTAAANRDICSNASRKSHKTPKAYRTLPFPCLALPGFACGVLSWRKGWVLLGRALHPNATGRESSDRATW